jgi:glycosyltransferase involved in cell wall biosynthesis
MLPQSFIQIHHHARPGGVTTVMRGYAEAFARLRPEHSANIVFSSSFDSEHASPARLIASELCDYKDFPSRYQLELTAQRIREKLRHTIESLNMADPLCLVLHNPGLAKNAALSLACAQCVRELRRVRDVRFFIVAHDFAEEGRLDRLASIARLRSWGLNFAQIAYPAFAGYIVPSEKNRILLEKAGVNACRLTNPVIRSSTGMSKIGRANLLSAISALARRTDENFDPARPIWFYPVRLISRKNIVEALLIACIIHDGNCILGSPGASRSDQALFDDCRQWCHKLSLRAVFDIERIAGAGRFGIDRGEVFPLVCHAADMCLSTSVAEGFGYALYEPLLYGKKIITRLPDMFQPESGAVFPISYRTLPVPVCWVDVRRLARKYWRLLNEAFPGEMRGAFEQFANHYFSATSPQSLIQNDTIDFAGLDYHAQWSILERLAGCGQSRAHMRSAFERIAGASRDRLSSTAALASDCLSSADAFDRAFARAFSRKHAPARDLDIGAISRHFATPAHFRLLLAPYRR